MLQNQMACPINPLEWGGSRQESLNIVFLCVFGFLCFFGFAVFPRLCFLFFFPSFQPVARFGLPDSQGPLSYSATRTPSHLGLAKGDILLRGSVYRIRKDQSSYSAPRTSSHLGLPKLYYTNTECLIWNNHVLLTFLQQPFF